jgi:hypothetical protein
MKKQNSLARAEPERLPPTPVMAGRVTPCAPLLDLRLQIRCVGYGRTGAHGVTRLTIETNL